MDLGSIQNQKLGINLLKVLLKMNNSTKKNFIFFSKDGYTYDKSNRLTNNMQLFGTGKGENIIEAFEDFTKNQLYLLSFDYENITAVQTVGEFITNLKLKEGK